MVSNVTIRDEAILPVSSDAAALPSQVFSLADIGPEAGGKSLATQQHPGPSPPVPPGPRPDPGPPPGIDLRTVPSGARLELNGPVPHTATIRFSAGFGTLQLDSPSSIQGTIEGFGGKDPQTGQS